MTKVNSPMPDGPVTECTSKHAVEGIITNKFSPHFECDKSAQICQGVLLKILGHSTDIKRDTKILEGMFKPPEDTSPSTLSILEKIARVWKKDGRG